MGRAAEDDELGGEEEATDEAADDRNTDLPFLPVLTGTLLTVASSALSSSPPLVGVRPALLNTELMDSHSPAASKKEQ